MKGTPKAIVLHSGGQDSSTCLAWAKTQWPADDIYPVSIDYGQRHSVELHQARRVCDELGVRRPWLLPLDLLSRIGGAALTDDSIAPSLEGGENVYAREHDLPSTFVPGRNLLLFTAALAYGAPLGAYNLVTGVCATDRAGYPDCRVEFVVSAENTLRLALDEPRVTIHAPLLVKSKAATFSLARELGVLDVILEHTHTCYNGVRTQRYPWGYGCGDCGACDERAKGWQAFNVGV